VAPALPCPFQEASRVIQERAEEEADVDVIRVRADVAECGIVDAGGRTSVVHQLAHITATSPHAREPSLCEGPQIFALCSQPGVNRSVVFHRRREAQHVIHTWTSEPSCLTAVSCHS
jgi:hypothetical protein